MYVALRKVLAQKNNYCKVLSIWVVNNISQNDNIEYEFLEGTIEFWL